LVHCPECGSSRYYKDGLRYANEGQNQRYLCRNCGYRFANNSYKECQTRKSRQICVLKAKNLTDATEPKTVAGEKSCSSNETIIDFAWQLKKRGLAESTIRQRVYRLRQLVKKGAKLTDPDTVSTILATSNWSESNKRVFMVAYKSFAMTFRL
jgi:hypothetical protein